MNAEKFLKKYADQYGNVDLSGTQIKELPENLTVNGWLDLSGTPIKTLPQNLVVGGGLDLSGTKITSLPENLTVGRSLDLRGTQITTLPENLTVNGWLDLCGTQITSLPENLTVNGSLFLSGTQITSLPENLTVGGGINLSETPITTLPENLTVGGRLNLFGTPITTLPKNLTVGKLLDLRRTQITTLPENLAVGESVYVDWSQITGNRNIHKLINGDYADGRYLFADGILTHIKRKKQIGDFTYYVGKIKGVNVIFDGENYAHCKTFEDGVCDLAFKKAKNRGAEQYKKYTKDTVVSFEEAKTMYRIITGACKAGTEQFIATVKDIKDAYTVGELIEITRGQYGSTIFENFFERRE